MSDVSVTAANVLASAQAVKERGRAGGTITAGQPLYADPADGGRLKPADCDASATTANVVGIALHGCGDEQPIEYAIYDPDFTPGFTLSLSAAADDALYVLSGTAGGVCPAADLAAGDYPVILYVAKSATKAVLSIVKGTAVLTS